MESEITEEILTAIGKVESLPRPARETLFTDVYEDVPWHLKEQQEELLAHEPAPTH
jgi:TPP-dependent pyruvate/acetoin dehydrogenase alpha subunit